MIYINLLPEELRPKKKAVFSFKRPELIIISVLGFILGLHIIFSILILIKNIQYNILNKRWQANKTEFKKLEEWKKENQRLTQDSQEVSKIMQQRILMQTKLKALSKNLPDDMWFRILRIKSKDLYLEGSIVSLEGEHMAIFRLFCDNLKKDDEFFRDILSFQIGPLKMRKVFNYEILDFIIEAKLK